MFYKKSCFVKISQYYQENTYVEVSWDEVEIKLHTVSTAILLKKRLQHRSFPVNIAIFLTTLVLKNICVQLLLKIIKDFLEKPSVTMIITC